MRVETAGWILEPYKRIMAFGNHFLDTLPKNLQEDLSQDLIKISLAKDAHIFRQEDPTKWIYFPVTTVISKYQLVEDGRSLEVSTIGNEGAAGLASAFGSVGAISSCQVLIAGTAFRIGAEELVQAFHYRPLLLAKILELMSRQIMLISKKLLCNHYHPVEQRLCTWLLTVSECCGSSRLSITHEQIALALGVHRPTITAITTSLRDKGMISYSRGHIVISNLGQVAGLACECYLDLKASNEREREQPLNHLLRGL